MVSPDTFLASLQLQQLLSIPGWKRRSKAYRELSRKESDQQREQRPPSTLSLTLRVDTNMAEAALEPFSPRLLAGPASQCDHRPKSRAIRRDAAVLMVLCFMWAATTAAAVS